MYKIDERVGCIAVVDEMFDANGLQGDLKGVVAFWSGVHGINGWEVLDWQREKARELCELLNNNASQQSFAPDVAKYCPQCGNKYDGVLCGECGFTTSPRR